MKILTHLSKEKINSVVQQKESYNFNINFNIDIDNKKYEATLYGYPIMSRTFGKIINSKIKIKNISFEDMSTLNFQVGQEIKIDDEDYYVASINADCLYERAEITTIKVK